MMHATNARVPQNQTDPICTPKESTAAAATNVVASAKKNDNSDDKSMPAPEVKTWKIMVAHVYHTCSVGLFIQPLFV